MAVIVIVVGVGGMSAAYHWYYQRYAWPAQIQKELFGHQIVDAEMLTDRIADSAYGQGMFRWTYRIGANNLNVQALCGAVTIKKCHFTKTRHLEEGADIDASYKDGVLILEEWWS